ncbi:ATP-binding cassette domain-containing protein [Methylobacterium sp. A49B]
MIRLGTDPAPAGHGRAWHRAGSRAWRLALALAAVALAANVALAGTAVTFLAAVALVGVGPAAFGFNFHHPAALVRLLALLRTVARYGERMAGHKAALSDQVRSRASLFAALARAPASRAAGWQLGRPERLADYIDDVADVDYARLRVGFPLALTGAALFALLAATAFVAPLALLPIAVLATTNVLLARRTADELVASEARTRSARRAAASDLGGALAGAVPLDAEGRRATALRNALDPVRDAEWTIAYQRRALARLEASLALAGPAAALAVLLVAWSAGARGMGLLPAAFLAFAWVGLAEPLLALPRALLGAVRSRLAQASLALEGRAGAETTPALGRTAGALTLHGLRLRAPDGRDLGPAPALSVEPGVALTVAGASGCGKTTLLKSLAGWSVDRPGEEIRLGGTAISAAQRRTLTYLGLHDAAVLADTVRENLFAPAASDADAWAALAAVELDMRIRSAGGLDAWIGEGSLSLGEAQRLNLARAALCNAPVILLDEPAEHLGDDQAERILRRLLTRWRDRVVVFTSHRPDLDLPARTVALEPPSSGLS